MNLAPKRTAIRPLFDEHGAEDAIDAYYAFHHPDQKTQLTLFPPDAERATGYVALSRTGLDLFRPLLTFRLPQKPEEASDLIYATLPPGAGLFISAPAIYGPLLQAFFDVQREQRLLLLRLDARAFEPVINVLVTETLTPDGLPRYVVQSNRTDDAGEVGAWAGLNWQSPYFAEIAVGTRPKYRQRGWGRSVVSALSQHVLQRGRTPLYQVAEHNQPSVSLAKSLGFRDTGARRLLLEASLRPKRP